MWIFSAFLTFRLRTGPNLCTRVPWAPAVTPKVWLLQRLWCYDIWTSILWLSIINQGVVIMHDNHLFNRLQKKSQFVPYVFFSGRGQRYFKLCFKLTNNYDELHSSWMVVIRRYFAQIHDDKFIGINIMVSSEYRIYATHYRL